MPDYFGSLQRVELSWAVFLLPIPTLVALAVWYAPLGLSATLRRSVAMASGLLTAAFTIGFGAALANLGPGRRALLGHAFSFVRVGSFDAGLTFHVDPLALGFAALVAVASWVLQARLGQEPRHDARRAFGLWWALGSLVSVLADDMALSLAGLAAATFALVLLSGESLTGLRHRRSALLGLPLVAAGWALLFWLPGGTWGRDDFVPDGRGRFGSVESKARGSAPPAGAKGGGEDGALTMTGSPGSWVVLDGEGGSTFPSPFARRRVSAGLHTARVVGGAASDDVELATFFVPPGGESFVAVVGPTSSLREARNQLALTTGGNKIDLRARLRDYRLLGAPAGVLAVALLALGGLWAGGLATPRRGGEEDEAGALFELPTLIARVVFAPYLGARAVAFIDPSPATSGVVAVVAAGLAAAAAFSMRRSRNALRALGPAADALALLATAMVFASAPAGALVVATAATAGLCLATIGAASAAKEDKQLYLSGSALLALPPMGIAVPWAAGHAAASLYAGKLELSLPLAVAFAVFAGGALFSIAFALFRLAPPGSLEALVEPIEAPAPGPTASDDAAADATSAPKPGKKGKKPKKGKQPTQTANPATLPTPSPEGAVKPRNGVGRLPQTLLALGAVAAIAGALPIGSLLGITLPVFGWVEEGAKLRPGSAPPAIAVAVALVLAGLGGYVLGKRARDELLAGPPAEPTADPLETDPLAPLGEALRGLRRAFAQAAPSHAADGAPLATVTESLPAPAGGDEDPHEEAAEDEK